MAMLRCEGHPPTGKKNKYEQSKKPLGYPNPAIPCLKCGKPAVLWLNTDEARRYDEEHERRFTPNTFTGGVIEVE